MGYIENLICEMQENEYDENYIALCEKYAKLLIENELPVIFDFMHLSLLLGYEPSEMAYYLFANDDEFYSEFNILKSNGTKRTIDVPSERLMDIQRWILDNILNKYKLDEHCFGFRKGKSVYDNALLHVNKPCVINMDIKNFFPSINQSDVFYIFYNKGYTKKVSYYLAKLTTKGNVLPQGAPTSPMISNIVASQLDKRLSCLGEKYHAVYSRYADDITFSGERNIKNMIPIVKNIIEDAGFYVNEDKTRYAYSYQRQEVTGLIVNKKVNIPNQYLKELKKEIYFCKTYGVNSHLKYMNITKSFYKEHLYGKVQWVGMINKELGEKLLNELNQIEWEY